MIVHGIYNDNMIKTLLLDNVITRNSHYVQLNSYIYTVKLVYYINFLFDQILKVKICATALFMVTCVLFAVAYKGDDFDIYSLISQMAGLVIMGYWDSSDNVNINVDKIMRHVK